MKRLWEIFNNAFDGIHPTFRQVPPSEPLPSIQAAFNPNYPALIAATYPLRCQLQK